MSMSIETGWQRHVDRDKATKINWWKQIKRKQVNRNKLIQIDWEILMETCWFKLVETNWSSSVDRNKLKEIC